MAKICRKCAAGDGTAKGECRENAPQDSRARQAEVEVKVERRPDFLHFSLDLNVNLPITLADLFSILLVVEVIQ